MTYVGDSGQISAWYVADGKAEGLTMRSGTEIQFVAPGSRTNGQYGLFHWRMGPGPGGPSAHFHKTFSESFYVLSGAVGLYDGDRWVSAQPGDFLYVPEGGIHAFRNDADTVSEMLILFAPGAPRENYFKELAEIAASGRQLSEAEWLEVYARNDQYPAG